jgi:hypothetical protein
MPANPNRDTQKARQYIAKKLTQIPSEGMVLNDLILDVLLSFAVSDSWPEKYIKRIYVDSGEFELEGRIILRVE